MKFGETFFQTKLLSRLSHRVYRRLSSPVLLRKLTNHNETGTHGKYEFGHLRKDKATGAVSGIVTGDALVSFRPLLLSLYNYMRNFCNLIGLEQWYLSLI